MTPTSMRLTLPLALPDPFAYPEGITGGASDDPDEHEANPTPNPT